MKPNSGPDGSSSPPSTTAVDSPGRPRRSTSRALWIDRDHTIFAVPLRAVERKVGGGHQLVCTPRFRERRDPETRGDLDLLRADRNGQLSDGDPEVLGQRFGAARI